MKDSILDSLEAMFEECSLGKLSIKNYLQAMEGFLSECETTEDVDTLMFYSMRGDWPDGLITCEKIAKQAISLRDSKKISDRTIQGRQASETYEFLQLAKHFAKFDKPQSKGQFLKFFDLAVDSAKTYLDHEILTASLTAAIRDMADESVDPGYERSRKLIAEAIPLAIQAKSIVCLESLAYIAEIDINDKKLGKVIKDAKKKLK
jgi:hypothetical protein